MNSFVAKWYCAITENWLYVLCEVYWGHVELQVGEA